MLHPAIPVTLLALVAPALASIGDTAPGADRRSVSQTAAARTSGATMLTQVTIRERVIIRVPRMTTPQSARRGGPALRTAPPAPLSYKERKGPKCIAAAELGGALIVQPGVVDLVLAGGRRVRARLDADCGPIDYYRGFYLRPAQDGKVCANRDVIRVRSGESCGISTFKTLQVVR